MTEADLNKPVSFPKWAEALADDSEIGAGRRDVIGRRRARRWFFRAAKRGGMSNSQHGMSNVQGERNAQRATGASEPVERHQVAAADFGVGQVGEVFLRDAREDVGDFGLRLWFSTLSVDNQIGSNVLSRKYVLKRPLETISEGLVGDLTPRLTPVEAVPR